MYLFFLFLDFDFLITESIYHCFVNVSNSSLVDYRLCAGPIYNHVQLLYYTSGDFICIGPKKKDELPHGKLYK